MLIKINNLNKAQQQALFHFTGPLLIEAGAGSGKTRVLTYKIAYLIKEKHISPQHILAITFTNKAAKEMRERVISLVGEIGYGIQISTFHSFGVRVIKEHHQSLNLASNFIILDENDSLAVIKSSMKELNLDIKYYNPKMIKNKISSAKNELIDEKKYLTYAKDEISKVVARVYRHYQNALINNNMVDFDDLLMLPVILFKRDNSILNYYQERYRYLLIDEYQDTNQAQYLLSKLISAKYQNIWVVGDSDQAIYGFRGADYQNILNFERDYKNAKVILLEENYRSTKLILEAANRVIGYNELRHPKNLWTSKEHGEKLKYYRAIDERDEALFIVNEIKNKVNSFSYNDIAILYRTNAQSRAIEEAFLKANIPYKIIGGYAFYNRKEIKDLLAYLKVIYNQQDNFSLLRCINNPPRGIGIKTINKLIDKANQEQKSIYEIISDGPAKSFKLLIEELKKNSEKLSLEELINQILDKSGLVTYLSKGDDLESMVRLENIAEFKSIIKAFEESHDDTSLASFLLEISLLVDKSEVINDQNRVSLMTIHAVKGLEFDIVFITGLEEGLFPHHNALDNLESLEEERRLFYVGLTRTKQCLYLLNAKNRLFFGERVGNQVSRFIEEIGDDYLKKILKKKSKRIPNITKRLFSNRKKFIHKKYGEGVIISKGKKMMMVAFPYPYGVKAILNDDK